MFKALESLRLAVAIARQYCGGARFGAACARVERNIRDKISGRVLSVFALHRSRNGRSARSAVASAVRAMDSAVRTRAYDCILSRTQSGDPGWHGARHEGMADPAAGGRVAGCVSPHEHSRGSSVPGSAGIRAGLRGRAGTVCHGASLQPSHSRKVRPGRRGRGVGPDLVLRPGAPVLHQQLRVRSIRSRDRTGAGVARSTRRGARIRRRSSGAVARCRRRLRPASHSATRRIPAGSALAGADQCPAGAAGPRSD